MNANLLTKFNQICRAIFYQPRYSILFFGLGIIAFHGWLLDPNNFFIHDDFSHFLSVQNSMPSFSFLPNLVYNDRPTGKIILYILWQLFADNQVLHHAAFLLIHFFNTTLVFFLTKFLQSLFRVKQFLAFPFLSALFFSLWPRSLFALWWISAVFDISSALFALLFLVLWFRYREKKTTLSLILLLIPILPMLRAKESAIFIPLIPIFTELLLFFSWKIKWIQLLTFAKKKTTLTTFAISMLTFLFSAHLLFLRSISDQVKLDQAYQYYTAFSPVGMIESLLRYFYLFFALNEVGGSFVKYSAIGVCFSIIFLSTLLLAWFKNKELRKLLVFAMGCAVLAFLPILPMVNNQQKLYLYLPSVFLSILVVVVAKTFLSYLLPWRALGLEITIFLGIMGISLTSQFLGGQKYDRHWWLTVGAENRLMWESLANISPPKSGDYFILTGVDTNTNIFYYGPGDAMRVYFNKHSISFDIVPSYETRSIEEYQNFRVLKLNNGKVVEISQ
jgi:hypothetical protein